MKLNILPSSKIDKKKWNKCVDRFHLDIYSEYHFLNAVCLDNWYGFVWGDYEKILPFYRKKKWGIIPYICMPPFCQKFDNRPLTDIEWQEAMNYLKRNNLKIDYAIRDRKNESAYVERFNFVLNKTNLNISQIREQYSSLLLKNLSKANKDLELSSDLSQVALDNFLSTLPSFVTFVLKKYAKNFRRLEASQLKYCYAYDKNECKAIAILMYVQQGNAAYLLFPYTTDEGKKRQAMSFLINSIIENSQIEIVDFEGSSIESIANFYCQFGAERQSYWSIHWKSQFLPI